MGCLFLLSLPLLFLSLQRFVFAGVDNSSGGLLTPIPWDLYHSSESLLKEVKALVSRHPDRLNMEIMTATNKGYAAEMVVVTYNHVKRNMTNKPKFRILLSFGQHGRELITSEVALHLLSVLTGEQRLHKTNPVSLESNLDGLVIKVVPMENLKGRKLVEAGDFCERRNGRGVDLNRNWSVDWGKKEKDYDPYEENPGSAPFSEPESQMLRKLSQLFDPHVWVNVHSGMEALFMPYDHKNVTPVGIITRIMRSVLEDLNHQHCGGRCLVGPGGGSVGYFAHGTSTDYMYDVIKVPMAFTFEIYGDSSASTKDCFKMFNPVDVASFSNVVENWCSAFLDLFVAGPQQLGKAHDLVSNELGKWVSMSGVRDGGMFVPETEGKRADGLDLGIQELRTYFRLFMLSCVLIMFMFCSRISKSKSRQTAPSIAEFS